MMETGKKKTSNFWWLVFLGVVLLLVIGAIAFGNDYKQLKPLDINVAVENCGTIIIPLNAKVTKVDGTSKVLSSGLGKAASFLIPAGKHTLTWSVNNPVATANNLDITVSVDAGNMYMFKYLIENSSIRYWIAEIDKQELDTYLKETNGGLNNIKHIIASFFFE